MSRKRNEPYRMIVTAVPLGGDVYITFESVDRRGMEVHDTFKGGSYTKFAENALRIAEERVRRTGEGVVIGAELLQR